MTMKNEFPEKDEIFWQLLLVGGLFAAPAMEELGKIIRDVLKQSGVNLNQSDFQILDRSTHGTSSVLIVKYTLDYTAGEGSESKHFLVEGSVASEVDFKGNVHIRLLSKPLPLYSDVEIGTVQSGPSPVKSNP